ncbi:HAD-IA family hydrolase [Paraburkholderia sp. J12]|uniref:HAD-IA family hydrolase n=1 Tax=Paraburkholderia sp. J12 TaxID=2805432 RepID=UPI002ABD93D9|nr:HAD-IA family hydrolase [Paraburkholderia sp. J12]
MASAISVVLFDMEGVLTHYDRNARTGRLAALTGATPEAVRHAIWGSGLEARADAGELAPDDYLAALAGLLGCAVTREAWLDSRHASIMPNEEALVLARRVARRHRVAVLTNNCSLVTDYLEYLNPAVAELFGSDIYGSAMFGAVKPAAQTYLGCVRHLGAQPAETLFIDDTEANVQGALDAGLQGYRFVDADALGARFVQLGLID